MPHRPRLVNPRLSPALRAAADARETSGIEGRIRLHDLRHAALTNLAATGASPIAVMATAGQPD